MFVWTLGVPANVLLIGNVETAVVNCNVAREQHCPRPVEPYAISGFAGQRVISAASSRAMWG